MVKIEGYVSKKSIRRMLENYPALTAGDRPPDAVPGNSGPKSSDGISNGFLTKIMLDDALAQLSDLTKACVMARWVYRLPMGQTLRALGIDKSVYYNRCDLAVEEIYRILNGARAGAKALLEKINKS